MSARRLRMLNAMGIDVWRQRNLADQSSGGGPAATGSAIGQATRTGAPEIDFAALEWDALATAAAACTACALCEGRTQAVFGTGNRNPRWLIVGEAPGADEDAQGEPFVGRAGQLLNAMIRATGVSREQVYIANIVKCRPPSNRNPRPEEALSCAPILNRQIELLEPDLILAVGRVAANNLLGNDETLGKLRGQPYRYGPAEIPLVVTYHPAYLLRKPSEKGKAWADLRMAMKIAAPVPA